MWVARNNAFPKTKDFEGIEKEGVISALKYYGYYDMAIVGSELMHYSFKKSADILGMGLKNIYTIPVDSEYRIRIDLLIEKLEELKRNKIKVIAIIGIACTTEVGSIDDFETLSNIAIKYNTLFHVDGAWGGSFIFSDKYKHLLKGIEKADTITIDGHKQLYTPIGCGIVLFKSPLLPTNTIRKVASYIIRSESMDNGKTTLEGSRPANVLYLNASLNLLGHQGFSNLLEMAVENTKYMAYLIKSYPQFEIINEPVANILLYRYIPSWLQKKNEHFKDYINNSSNSKSNKESSHNNDNKGELSFSNNLTKNDKYSLFSNKENQIIDDFNTRLQEKQKIEGKGFVSKTTIKTSKYPDYIKGIVVLRVVIANPLVNSKIIKEIVDEQIYLSQKIEKEY